MRFPHPTRFVWPEEGGYLQAKAAMVRLWTPLQPDLTLPICAVCGWGAVNPEAHHVISRRYAKCDIRNMVPVCNQGNGDCHQQAQGRKKYIAIQRLYYVIGGGDPIAGRECVLSATMEWFAKSTIRIPPVDGSLQDGLWSP
jgi:hypothetical protein